MLSKFSNFPDELSESDESKEYELSGFDCIDCQYERRCKRFKAGVDKNGFYTLTSQLHSLN